MGLVALTDAGALAFSEIVATCGGAAFWADGVDGGAAFLDEGDAGGIIRSAGAGFGILPRIARSWSAKNWCGSSGF
jgi:hypothetical protein